MHYIFDKFKIKSKIFRKKSKKTKNIQKSQCENSRENHAEYLLDFQEIGKKMYFIRS